MGLGWTPGYLRVHYLNVPTLGVHRCGVVFEANKEFLLFAAYLMSVKVLLSSKVSISSRHSALQTHTRLEKLYLSCNKADYWPDASSGSGVSVCRIHCEAKWSMSNRSFQSPAALDVKVQNKCTGTRRLLLLLLVASQSSQSHKF